MLSNLYNLSNIHLQHTHMQTQTHMYTDSHIIKFLEWYAPRSVPPQLYRHYNNKLYPVQQPLKEQIANFIKLKIRKNIHTQTTHTHRYATTENLTTTTNAN